MIDQDNINLQNKLRATMEKIKKEKNQIDTTKYWYGGPQLHLAEGLASFEALEQDELLHQLLHERILNMLFLVEDLKQQNKTNFGNVDTYKFFHLDHLCNMMYDSYNLHSVLTTRDDVIDLITSIASNSEFSNEILKQDNSVSYRLFLDVDNLKKLIYQEEYYFDGDNYLIKYKNNETTIKIDRNNVTIKSITIDDKEKENLIYKKKYFYKKKVLTKIIETDVEFCDLRVTKDIDILKENNNTNIITEFLERNELGLVTKLKITYTATDHVVNYKLFYDGYNLIDGIEEIGE